ncbi:restriction endonuclease subunit S [Mariprofundus ferrooxydans]|nr:restriction endonuclease subunit S [Mariprofundus ferrooxydans]
MLKTQTYENMKDSGVEWLGEIPEHWLIKKITHAYKDIGSGTTPPSGNLRYYDGEINWLQTGDLTDGLIDKTSRKVTLRALKDCSALKLFPRKSLVIAMYGATIGKVGLLNIETTTNQACCVIGSSIHMEMRYAFYEFQGFKQVIISMGYGGGQPNISQDLIKSLRLPCPPLPEQKAIADFLDRKTGQIDAAMAIKKKQIELLKERKQILIQNAVTQGLNPDAPKRDSSVAWIGEIPVHWRIFFNRTLFEERVEAGREGLPLLSVSIHSAVSNEEMADEDNIRGRVKIEDKSKYNLVQPDDIVYNMMRAWQGAIGAVRIEGMVSPAYTIAVPNELVDSSFFEYQYRSPIFIQQMDRNSKGITDFRKRLYWDEFKQLITIVPPIDEQIAIVAHIETQSAKIDQAIALNQQQIEKLKEYKTTLINSAVTGKIKVAREGQL